MTGLAVLVRKELLEQWRTRRLALVVVVFVAFGILAPILARYTPELIKALVPPEQVPVTLPRPTLADAVAQFVKSVGQTLAFASILLAMGLVAGEKERGTAAFILTRPAGRAAFIVAKLIGVATTLAVAMGAAGAAAWIYTAWLFEPPGVGPFAAMCAVLWLVLVALAAITLLGSVVARSAIAAGAIGFGGYVGLAIVSALPTVGPFVPLGLLGPAQRLGMGDLPPDLIGPLVVNALIVAGTTLLAWLAFRRQEL